MDLKEVMAVNLRRLRHAKGMTQEELAERAGLSARYVGGIERADVSASVTVLGRIAEALEVEAAELVRAAPAKARKKTAVEPRFRDDCGSRLAPEEFDRVRLKDLGELLQHVDGRGVLFALQHANIVAIDARTVGKLLLRHAFGMSQSSQIRGDDLPQAHAVRSPCHLIYCHLVN